MSACSTGKKSHPTKQAAEQFAREWTASRPESVPQHAYICESCGQWHLSTQDAVSHNLQRSHGGCIGPIVTSSRPIFVQKKIDEGHNVNVDDMILKMLRTAFVTDDAVAKELCVSSNYVFALRRKNKIPGSRQRARNAIVDLLAAEPGRNREDIARELGVQTVTVFDVARQLGIKSSYRGFRGAKNVNFNRQMRGAANPYFGKKHTPEIRAKIAAAVKGKIPAICGETGKKYLIPAAFKGHVHTPETKVVMAAKARARQEKAFLKTVAWG